MLQGGAGTATNRNVNEVIANRGLELLGHKKGEYTYLDPTDDVNLSQSTNDSYPTAAKLAIVQEMTDTLTALDQLKLALSSKAMRFCSSRTLPGQSYSRSHVRASSEKLRCGRL